MDVCSVKETLRDSARVDRRLLRQEKIRQRKAKRSVKRTVRFRTSPKDILKGIDDSIDLFMWSIIYENKGLIFVFTRLFLFPLLQFLLVLFVWNGVIAQSPQFHEATGRQILLLIFLYLLTANLGSALAKRSKKD